MLYSPEPCPRRGAIAPLTAVMSLFILGMVAFSIDTSWIVLTETELQAAADSAALAGVNKLMDSYVLYNLPGQTPQNQLTILNNGIAEAKSTAKKYASYNGAGGVNSLSLRDEDIEVGFLDASNNFNILNLVNLQVITNFPNTVKVVLRRDSVGNGPLNLFFAPAIGTKTSSLSVTASATMYGGTINSLGTDSKVGMLPMAYDQNDWNNFMKTAMNPDGNISKDKSGNPQLLVYPSVKDTGNFGLLGLDDEHAGASEVSDWIHNGLAPAEVKTLISRNLIPLSAHDNTKWDWLGGPGFKSSVVSTINEYTGKSFLLPLFQSKSGSLSSNDPLYQAGVGNGTNYDYNIVAFVGVKIAYTNDANRDVIVQPSAVIEPNAIFLGGAPAPVGTTGSIITTFATPKLTR